MVKKGSLILVGVPIGNIDDISPRAIECLKKQEIILCEDTRASSILFMNFSIQARLISHVGSYHHAITKASEQIESGKDIALVCDRGMPCISDPGASIVSHFRERNIKIECIPGASALTTAFSMTGYTGGFIFHGFLPRKPGAILKIANTLKDLDYNIIFFESPIRIKNTLILLKTAYADRSITIARELTKKYESIVQGTIDEVLKHEILGECVIVISRFT